MFFFLKKDGRSRQHKEVEILRGKGEEREQILKNKIMSQHLKRNGVRDQTVKGIKNISAC